MAARNGLLASNRGICSRFPLQQPNIVRKRTDAYIACALYCWVNEGCLRRMDVHIHLRYFLRDSRCMYKNRLQDTNETTAIVSGIQRGYKELMWVGWLVRARVRTGNTTETTLVFSVIGYIWGIKDCSHWMDLNALNLCDPSAVIYCDSWWNCWSQESVRVGILNSVDSFGLRG